MVERKRPTLGAFCHLGCCERVPFCDGRKRPFAGTPIEARQGAITEEFDDARTPCSAASSVSSCPVERAQYALRHHPRWTLIIIRSPAVPIGPATSLWRFTTPRLEQRLGGYHGRAEPMGFKTSPERKMLRRKSGGCLIPMQVHVCKVTGSTKASMLPMI